MINGNSQQKSHYKINIWRKQSNFLIPHSSVGKESVCSAGDPGTIPESGGYPGEGNGNPLQYSCLENPMDRRAWQVTVHGVTRVGHDLVTKPPPSPKQVQDGFWDFLGSPVVKTLHFQCRGHGFSSWFGN